MGREKYERKGEEVEKRRDPGQTERPMSLYSTVGPAVCKTALLCRKMVLEHL